MNDLNNTLLQARLEEAGRNYVEYHQQQLREIARRNIQMEREERRLQLAIRALGVVLVISSLSLLWLVWGAL